MNHESVRIAIERTDAPLAIMEFITLGRGNILPYGAVWEKGGWWKREANEANLAYEVLKTFADAETWFPVRVDQILTDRTYRNAWASTSGKDGITHDMPKARELHREILRRARAPMLEALDVEYLRAQETGDPAKVAAVALRKQTLRDVTKLPAIEAAQTVEELKRIVMEGA